jgi:4-amino-4-deoxy-L-arabinose transferase-like glycosyltransferase
MTSSLAAPPAIETPAEPPVAGRRPAWIRPAVALLLFATGVLYIWDLSASGWANAFYSAAVQAGSHSWKAYFYGSSDSSNFITVDKPPASLWVMDISARIFGVNAWSILIPNALEGVAAVGLLYLTVRRWFGAVAGLLAGAVLALTPVAVLMFRFNNPDALLTLLMVAAAYAVTRALERASARWLALAGALIGFGFLTKMLQALLVVPAFAIAYLIAAPTTVRRRLLHLLAAGGALIVSAGWWVAVVSLVPAADRPYIGGSQHNSILELIFGYNGFGRLDGNETGSVGGGGGTGMWGATGWTRLFGSDLGGQVAWLLPAALLSIVAGAWLTRRAARTDRTRAAFVIWGGWLLVTAAVFSFMAGIFHPYYTVALAPAIAALVGIGAVLLWRRCTEPLASAALAVGVALTTFTSYELLNRSSDWHPWLSAAVVVVGALATVALLVAGRMRRRLALVMATVALVVSLAGPAAYALETATTPHSGSIPSAGPTVSGGGFGPGGGRGPGGGPGFPGGPGGSATNGGGTGGTTTNGGGTGGTTTGGPGTGGTTGGGPGGGGLLNATTPSAALTSALQSNASHYRWVAAAVGSQNASGYQLASGEPVMAIGGFNGSDPAPTLAQFEAYVAAGRIHYFIGGDGIGGSAGGSSDSQAIASWVASHYTAETIGGTTVYDLTSGTTS